MCEVCAIFGAGEHWSDFGRERNERFPFADIQHYRTERRRRLGLLNRLLEPMGLCCEDWDGEAVAVLDRHGRQRLAPTLGDIWAAADAMAPGQRVDPLDPTLLARLGDG